MMSTRVAIDAMGGDNGPFQVAEGVALFLQGDSRTRLLLVGHQDEVVKALGEAAVGDPERVEVRHASQVFEMHERVSALRQKTDSSVVRAVEAVAKKDCESVVLIGNTAAAVAAGTHILKMLPGVRRPGIAVPLPTTTGKFTIVIDVGANVHTKPADAVVNAIMASIYVSEVLGITNPSVGLLNVGQEPGKGNAFTSETFALLENAGLNFAGNVEASGVFRGDVDVAVCDGFAGNIMLKAAEAAAELVMESVLKELPGADGSRLVGKLKKRFDYGECGGALLLGVNGRVIIGHGKSSALAVASAIAVARDLAEKHLNKKIVSRLSRSG